MCIVELFSAPMCRITDLAKEDVLEACKFTLQNLQLEYLDLYLIHWPVGLKKGTEQWKLTDDCKLGYNAETIAKCWEVRCDLHVHVNTQRTCYSLLLCKAKES